MDSQWDVVIVGGGVVGVCTAWRLAERDVDVVLLEAGSIPSAVGSTARSAGGFRHLFDDVRKVELVERSAETFRRYAARADDPLWERGYLFLARTRSELAHLQAAAETVADRGVETDSLTPAECQALVPSLRVDDLRGGSVCAGAGTVDPAGFLRWVAARAEAAGATIREHEPVVGLASTDGFAVETPEETYLAPTVLDAAGVWAPRIAAALDVHLEATPARIQIVEADRHHVDESAPFVVDLHAERYFWPGATGTRFGGGPAAESPPPDPETYDRSHDPTFVTDSAAFASRRLGVDGFTAAGGWAGLKGLTPDGDPLVGEVAAHDGFYVATGWNGHGFMLAPAVGQALAAHMLTGEWADVDLSAYDPDRFADGVDSERSFMGT